MKKRYRLVGDIFVDKEIKVKPKYKAGEKLIHKVKDDLFIIIMSVEEFHGELCYRFDINNTHCYGMTIYENVEANYWTEEEREFHNMIKSLDSGLFNPHYFDKDYREQPVKVVFEGNVDINIKDAELYDNLIKEAQLQSIKMMTEGWTINRKGDDELKNKEMTTLEMLSELFENQNKVFVTVKNVGKVGFINGRLCWLDSGDPFYLTFENGLYYNTFDYKWTEIIETIKFDDWENGKVYTAKSEDDGDKYTLILNEPHYYFNSTWRPTAMSNGYFTNTKWTETIIRQNK